MEQTPRPANHHPTRSDEPTRDAGGGPARPGLRDLLGRQRASWLRGERAPVEALLRQHPDLAGDDEAVLDLIYNEYILREQEGDRLPLEEYYRRFPRYEEQLRRLLKLDRALLGDAGPDTQSRDSTFDEVGPPQPPPAGLGRVGKYPLVALLGEGGQATVYRAVQPDLGRDVVIKVSRRAWVGAAADRDRLLEEGRILAELNHPNVAHVYDVGVDEGRPFLVMEYIPGRTLEHYARETAIAPRQAAALVAPLARALAAIHRRGVTHLDLKPTNVLIDERGQPHLIDFGLALRRQGWAEEGPQREGLSGTLAYMSPEQASGDNTRVGPRSDVFGLGAVLYFLLTGRPLFGAGRFDEVLRCAQTCTFDRDALRSRRTPRRLAAICLRALSADPAARQPRAEVLAAELEAFVRGPAWRGWAAAASALLLAACLGLGLFWWAGGRAGAPPDHPQAPAEPSAPHLAVRVWDGERYVDLAKAAPLRTRDQLQASVAVPPDSYAGLFLFGSDGRLSLLASRGPDSGPGELRFPPKEHMAAPLQGPPGTEFLLVCGRRAGPFGLDDVRACWGDAAPLPALPELSVFRLRPSGVALEQHGKGLGAPVDRPDPEGEVRRLLDELRSRLRERFDFLEGLAFAHTD